MSRAITTHGYGRMVPFCVKATCSDPPAKFAESTSVTVAAGAIFVNGSFAVYASVADVPLATPLRSTTGASFTPVTLTNANAMSVLCPPFDEPSPSLSVNVTIRGMIDGFSDEF